MNQIQRAAWKPQHEEMEMEEIKPSINESKHKIEIYVEMNPLRRNHHRYPYIIANLGNILDYDLKLPECEIEYQFKRKLHEVIYNKDLTSL
ncbi:CLUMA_CG006126, isoform A [Clunio marinus]|uniref:CLUMA_CG006126, isoform A n=1 Tax=Clunio marinus TaxID=568069 RepID=A0A1J1HX23_9DIPT|nr:CLUMA_CG006126, isoform A [Clunio marinus]